MAKDLKKFVNARFLRTIDLGLMRSLLDRHADALHGLDLSLLNGDPGAARQMLQKFFAGPEEGYPKDLLIELYAVAELGTATGQQILLEHDWRLNHLTLRVHFDVGDARPVTVTVKIKPPRTAMFKRHRFEERIMTLLRRNGLINDRLPVRAAAAAE